MQEMYVPGKCIGCYKDLFVLDAVRGRMRETPTKEYSEAQFKLDDGSFVRLPLCIECNDKLQDDQHKVFSTRLSNYLGKDKRIKTKIRRMRSIDAIGHYAIALEKRVRERVQKRREELHEMRGEGQAD